MKIYNTLSRKIESFRPIKDDLISLYTCGPTVYDYAQIGNLRAFVFDDTLRRALEISGCKVKHVMNITDVGHLSSDEDEGEDKVEWTAVREKKSVWDIANFFTSSFERDVKALNILPPNGYKGTGKPYARATDFINEQLELVNILIDKGFAYQTEQAIYFKVSGLADYGKLTGQKLSEKEVGARPEVVTDPAKQHPQDFALWFFKVGRFADHSMSWPSKWGEGFPGWHLECSAIIHATLGEPIDFHLGGVDHIGTHHTNEIAQTEAAFDVDLAHYWVHNEYLLVNGEKMSKSKGNFFTLKDVLDRGYQPLSLRLLFLQAHYRTQMNFNWEALTSAQVFLVRLQAWADLKFQPNAYGIKKVGESYAPTLSKIKSALLNDLNTAEALGLISNLATSSEAQGVDQSSIQNLLEEIDKMFGLELANRQDINASLKELIASREKARVKKDWPKADEIRQELLASSIELNDTPNGPIWRRV